MKYTTEVGSGAMIYIPSFLKTGLCIQTFKGVGIHRYIYRQNCDCISPLYESRLKIKRGL
jgi:hypothetical protein